MNTEKKRESGFERDLEHLEAVVAALEAGGLPLEEALKQFEAGIRLARKCEKALRDAERKVEVLIRNLDGELAAKPFEEDGGNTELERPGIVFPSSESEEERIPWEAGPQDAEPEWEDRNTLF